MSQEWLQIQSQARQGVEWEITPGINVGYREQDKWSEFSKGYIDDNTPTRADIFYDIASISKTFTASLMLYEVNQNHLQLTQPIKHFLPFTKILPDLTILHLLTHTSGLQLLHKYDKQRIYSQSEAKDIFFNENNLQVERVGETRYSDLNFLLLGRILEEIYQQNLADITEYFLEKFDLEGVKTSRQLALSQTWIAPSQSAIERGRVQDEKAWWLGGLAGHAGLFASLRGLEKWVDFWLHNQLGLSEQLYQQALGVIDPVAQRTLSEFEKSQELIHNPKFGLVWRRGWLSNYPNYAGFSGPSVALDPYSGKALVQTCNYHYHQRTDSHRQRFLRWNRKLFGVWGLK